MNGPPEPRRPGVTLTRSSVLLAVVVLLIVGAVGLAVWSMRPRLSEEEVRDVVVSTIQREVPESFLVTGAIETTAVTRVSNTKTLLPGIIGLDLGTTTATVRVPGRISYGFDVRGLTPAMIDVGEDGIIEVEVPEPSVYSVEPNLEQMEIETQRGWARISDQTMTDVRARAIELVQQTMRTQGAQHLNGSEQPRINTARALYRMLHPVLVAAGIDDPQIRFRVGRSIVMEPGQEQ